MDKESPALLSKNRVKRMADKKPKVYLNGYISEAYRIKDAAVYIRISTPREKQTSSMDNQISKLVDYVQKELLLRLRGVYVDIGSGRSAESRKELRRLLDDCKSGDVEAIVTKSVSRFGRNTVDTLTICRHLKELGIDVYFDSERIHSIGPDGELSLTIASAIAESESYEKSTSIKWGLQKSAQNPDSRIFSRICYGYRKDDDGNLVIYEEQAEVVRTIFQMYLAGASIMKIKCTLEQRGIPAPLGGTTWPKRTIEKILGNEKYSGNVILYKTYTAEYPAKGQIVNQGQREMLQMEGHHPAIIALDQFNEVQIAIAVRKRKNGTC